MKLCINCRLVKSEVVPVGQRGTDTMYQAVPFCGNPDYANPVDGTLLPCQHIRANDKLCGMSGRGWKEAEAEQPKPEGKVIQLIRPST